MSQRPCACGCASRSPRHPQRAAAAEARPPSATREHLRARRAHPPGLHLADVENLLGLLDRLVDAGKSAIVIEHHQAVMAHADWIIDLGPGAGRDGGRIVFEGTPADLIAALHAHGRAPGGICRGQVRARKKQSRGIARRRAGAGSLPRTP